MKRKRLIVDAAMVLVLPLLMAYSLIGERFHELAGSLMLILFLVHHCLNKAWSWGLFRGKYSPDRIFQTALNVMLFLFMILQPLCGILMSKYVYTFLPTEGLSSVAREIHLPLAHWGFTLMSIHAGTHLRPVIRKLPAWIKLGGIVVSAYGAYAFIKRQFPSYMFLQTGFGFFDFSEPAVFFVLDVLCMMILFAACGYGVKTLLING